MQKLQRPQIDLFVAARAGLDGRAAFCEGRRIENDGIESFAGGFHFTQRVKNICGLELNVTRVIQLCVALRRRDRFLRDIYTDHAFARFSQVQRKSAVEGKAIQRAAVRYPGGSKIVLTLIKKGAGFLTRQRTDDESHGVLMDLNVVGRVTVEHALPQLESFKLSHPRVVPLANRSRLELFNYQFKDFILQSIRSL